MAEEKDLHQFLLQQALNSYQEEYKELLNNWRELEKKAQATATIAGAFIAGIFLFLRQGLALSLEVKIFIIIAILLLVWVFFRSIIVLNVEKRYMPPSSERIYTFVMDLLNLKLNKDELEDMIPYFINDRISLWKVINEILVKINKDKAENINVSQMVLIADVIVFSIAISIFLIET